MKRWRVMVTCSLLASLVLFVFLVPVPINRLRTDRAAIEEFAEHHGDLLVRLLAGEIDGERLRLLLVVGDHAKDGVGMLLRQVDRRHRR